MSTSKGQRRWDGLERKHEATMGWFGPVRSKDDGFIVLGKGCWGRNSQERRNGEGLKGGCSETGHGSGWSDGGGCRMESMENLLWPHFTGEAERRSMRWLWFIIWHENSPHGKQCIYYLLIQFVNATCSSLRTAWVVPSAEFSVMPP